MLIEKDIRQMLHQLSHGKPINVAFDGLDIMIRFFDDESKLSLKSTVYRGSDYIPQSVRHCLTHKMHRYGPEIRTFLSVDENRFQVNLHFLGHAESLSRNDFKEILEEFGTLAEKWHHYLDDHDQRDLIHVKIK